MSTNHNHTHPKDCPDQKAAAADRKRHADVMAERQRRQQALAHAEWFEWLPAPITPRSTYATT
jgi:hypothetical protein